MNATVWVRNVSSVELKAAAGIAGLWGRLVTPSVENDGMIVGLGMIPAHTDMGWHEHPEAEVFLVLEGVGDASWIEDGRVETASLEPGSAFYKLGGVSHRMTNNGDSALVGAFFKIKPME